jgi:hypothetical protein
MATHGPNLSRLHDWASGLSSSLSRGSKHATDLVNQPITWLLTTIVLAGLALGFARGETPSPFMVQVADGVRFPILRWPAEGEHITSPLAQPPAHPPERPRRRRQLRARRPSP